MYLYALRAKGVYWKDLVGIFGDLEEAKKACDEKAKNDVDDYHLWCVTKHALDVVDSYHYLDEVHTPIYTKRKVK